MFDLHTHILPGMDDGAKDVAEASALIELLKMQGVETAVLTPHYHPYLESVSDFSERRRLSYESIKDCGFDMILASETYLSESLFSNDSIDELAISNTGHLLLELPFQEKWGSSVFRQIGRIITKYNIKPIIAHAERYEPVQINKEKELKVLVDLGCRLQFNIDSFIDRRTRSAAMKYFRRGWVDFVGSDCHNLTDRRPRFDEFQMIMKKKMKCEYQQECNYDTGPNINL